MNSALVLLTVRSFLESFMLPASISTSMKSVYFLKCVLGTTTGHNVHTKLVSYVGTSFLKHMFHIMANLTAADY